MPIRSTPKSARKSGTDCSSREKIGLFFRCSVITGDDKDIHLINVWDTGIQKAMDYFDLQLSVEGEIIILTLALVSSYPAGFNSFFFGYPAA
jgi:hypothetical protein